MTAAMAMPSNTAMTFLVSFLQSRSGRRPLRGRAAPGPRGRRHRCSPHRGTRTKGRRRTEQTKRGTGTPNAVKDLRPATTETIICSGLKARGGVQGLGVRRRRNSNATANT